MKFNFKYKILGTLLFLAAFSFCQISVQRYQKDFYVVGATHIPWKIINTKDSGTCTIGHILSGRLLSTELTRLDKYGNLKWNRSYCTSVDSVYDISSIENTLDNGFLS